MSHDTTRINAECAAGIRPCEPGCRRFGSASPPTENARAGADEVSIDIPVRETLNRHGLPAPNVDIRWNMNIVSAVREAYAVGRARGLEEGKAVEKERCDSLVRWRLRGERSGLRDALQHALLDIQQDRPAIADAIAKETGK